MSSTACMFSYPRRVVAAMEILRRDDRKSQLSWTSQNPVCAEVANAPRLRSYVSPTLHYKSRCTIVTHHPSKCCSIFIDTSYVCLPFPRPAATGASEARSGTVAAATSETKRLMQVVSLIGCRHSDVLTQLLRVMLFVRGFVVPDITSMAFKSSQRMSRYNVLVAYQTNPPPG